jgi:iron complex outermembrane recepter protein
LKRYCYASAAFGVLAAYLKSPAAAGENPIQFVSDEVEQVLIIGIGEARQSQTVPGDDLRFEAPGASPLKAVEKLPSVNLQAADAFGSYEWSTRITVRGFNQSQLGFTLDDVPLGDMTYGNHNGLHISRAIISENIEMIELAQGAGALETASSSNLGGTLKFYSRDPLETFNAEANGTLGTDSFWRGFVRLETGRFTTGTRASLSYAQYQTDKWKGAGIQKQQQVNFKAVQEVGASTLTGWLNWSKRRENDYQDLSLAMIDRLGHDWDNISHDWDLAVEIAEIGNNRGDTGVPPQFPAFGTVYPTPIETIDDAYFNASGLRDDTLGAITLDVPFGRFRLRSTVYGHRDEGQGLWYTPYVPSPNYGLPGANADAAPISIRTTEYDLERYGTVTGGTLTLDRHEINAGVWYEDNSFNQARRFYGLDRDAPQRSSLEMQSDPFLTQWEYDFGTITWQFHIQDTWTVTDALRLNFGFKALSVENTAHTIVGADKTGTIKAEEGFLPQVGAVFDLNLANQFFADYSRNMRAFPSSGTSGPFSGTQTAFLAIKDTLKPEISDTFEIGWRYRSESFQGVLAFYHVTFKDRLFAVPVGSGIIGNPTALSNVGGVTANGVEFAGIWNFAESWNLFGSYAWNESRFDEDTVDGDGVIVGATKDRRVVDTPEHMLKAELGYDDGALFGRLGLSYMSERYFSYENDVSVPAQTLFDLALGYRITGFASLNALEIQLTVSNLFDEDYISTINSNGFPIRGDSQTLLPGAPRQAFITLRAIL